MPASVDDGRPPSPYRVLLRLPGAALFAATAAAGRIGIAMTGLGLLLLVRERSGSFATAGAVVAAFAVAEALLGPQVARLVDRWGQSRVLPPLVAAHAAAVAGLLLSPVPPLALAALAGATIPQLGALSTARWVALLRGRRLAASLPAAFSLESLVNALAYLAGPVLVSVLAGAVDPALGTGVAAGLVVASGLALALQRSTSPPAGHPAHHPAGGGGGLLRPGFLAVLLVNLAIGVHFGASQVAVTAFAVERGTPALAGVLFGISSGAGLLAGWAYGLRRWGSAPPRQLVVLGAALAVACTALSLSTALPVAVTAVLLAGAVVPPVLVLSTVLAEAHVDPRSLTQALTWLNSAAAGGSAGATALAGLAVDARGAPAAFLVSVAAGAALALVAGVGARVLGQTVALSSNQGGRP
ncbi:MFS transporter [Kineococcus rubinsiae]|uniref:MFS transporter n=1 Tax=Kineococcus rubinsiae TaxID=2609562 RepID=UPI0014303EE1|nr:MFS transporter [Kineococcus rubinsiae]NIZ89867.1 MFS transporter [Kineococcus rubinsiae]